MALWGYTVGGSVTRWVLAIAVPVAFATLWAVFISPKAARPLDDPARLAAELALFGLAVVALVHADQPRLAVIVGVAVTVHLALTFPLDQR